MVKAQRSSDYIVFRDKVVEVLNYLPETPIKQMGMNYSRTVSTNDKDVWERIGTKFVKRDPWQKMISYFDNLETKKQKELGLFGLTYHFLDQMNFRVIYELRWRFQDPQFQKH